MFCIQCEQTLHTATGVGCRFARGDCGKTAAVSDLQDALICALMAVSSYAVAARAQGIIDAEVDAFVPKALFATLTNVNFDPERLAGYTTEAQKLRDRLRGLCAEAGAALPSLPALADATWPSDAAGLSEAGRQVALDRDAARIGADVMGLRLLCLYGLKGIAAYMEHARVLGQTDPVAAAGFHRHMAFLATEPTEARALFAEAMAIGTLNFRVMEMLDAGATGTFGDPVPTPVNRRPVAGKAILVSGHDLHDLLRILEQTAGRGINVYTHGEMLPAHAYPAFKVFPHLVGHYGSAWQNQQSEFAAFPGAIVMTSNCLIDPRSGAYQDRIFTRSIVGWPGVRHIEDEDFAAVVACAETLAGFAATEPVVTQLTGFGRATLLDAAPAVLDKVKSGKIRHFYLIGGCDGTRAERSYYADLARALPQDTVVLTLGCGKFRLDGIDFGSVDGLPRLLDLGQCNDAYAAIRLAVALSEALGCGVNDLPLTLVLSWFEQKAIVILLTLLALGVRDIRVGPTAPGFLTPNLIATLNAEFGLRLISTPEETLAETLCA
ncbi:hydroxylamine reductase precursor [Rhodobacter viridis]|uniref:Hydroxylamine reductase n=1 Tax=Rhodobacter viridis TaxID=1054202 RepID=A0A318TUX7_9RHOB|nr:hydroxylamine reductase [Rhodobacter viridis]PYF08626.1 hydroxylamine reductase precursor [Rhodobacter viridis]